MTKLRDQIDTADIGRWVGGDWIDLASSVAITGAILFAVWSGWIA